MHSRIFEIESRKGYIENDCGGGYELPEWWTDYYCDWYDEEEEKESKESLDWLSEAIDVKGDMVDFSGKKGRKRLEVAYKKAVEKAKEISSLSFEEFSGRKGFVLMNDLSSEVEDKYDFWFYVDGCDMCTLDEMLHSGGEFHLTGRTWDYHF